MRCLLLPATEVCANVRGSVQFTRCRPAASIATGPKARHPSSARQRRSAPGCRAVAKNHPVRLCVSRTPTNRSKIVDQNNFALSINRCSSFGTFLGAHIRPPTSSTFRRYGVHDVDDHQEDPTVPQRRRELLRQDAGAQPAPYPLVRPLPGDGDVTAGIRAGGPIHQNAETRNRRTVTGRAGGPTGLRRRRNWTIQEHRVCTVVLCLQRFSADHRYRSPSLMRIYRT